MIATAAPPRVRYVPAVEAIYDLAEAAIELAASCGMPLDVWQQDEVRAGLAYTPDGKWVAGEVGSCVPRQNGKNGVTEVRQAAGLFLVSEFPVQRHHDPLAVHTAHLNDTAAEAHRRLVNLIEANDELTRKVRRVSWANGKEAIQTMSGERIRYRARTKGGARGWAGDDVYLDEAMFIPEFGFGAMRPIVSARPNPQIWFTGSAVDQEFQDDGVVFARVRERAIEGGAPRLVYFEWSLPYERPDDVPEAVLTDPEAWAQANPALGVRILEETVAEEQRSMAARTFIVERLGVGDWPDTDQAQHVVDLGRWAELADRDSAAADPVQFAFDVSPDRSRSAIAVAGHRKDALQHGEVVRRDAGTDWVVPELKRLVGAHACLKPPICDGNSPAASLLQPAADAGLLVETTTAGEMAQACGGFFDAVVQGTMRHLGQSELTNALKGAAKRPLGDAWAWSRKNSSIDISPLVAVTLALWRVGGPTEGGFEW